MLDDDFVTTPEGVLEVSSKVSRGHYVSVLVPTPRSMQASIVTLTKRIEIRENTGPARRGGKEPGKYLIGFLRVES